MCHIFLRCRGSSAACRRSHRSFDISQCNKTQIQQSADGGACHAQSSSFDRVGDKLTDTYTIALYCLQKTGTSDFNQTHN